MPGLRTLKWWAAVSHLLREPVGGWNEYVMLEGRPSLFGCPSEIEMNGRKTVCGSRLTELRGLVPCGSFNLKRWYVCKTCGFKKDREAGLLPFDYDEKELRPFVENGGRK